MNPPDEALLREELARCQQELARARSAQGDHQLEQLFTLSLDLICIAGTDGYFRRINPSFAAVLGWTEAELLARPFLDFVHPDDLQKTLDEVARISEGLNTVSFENRYLCADGSWKHLAWKSRPSGDGMIYAVARDMTETHRAIRQREAALAKSAHQQGRVEMAAGILHDLGNALTGIGSQATAILNALRRREGLQNLTNTAAFLRQHRAAVAEALGEQRADALPEILEAIRGVEAETRFDTQQHLEKLLSAVRHGADLLATHRSYSEAGSAPALERLLIADLFRDVALLVEDGVLRRQGKLLIEVEADLPLLHIERSKALQVLLNLLKNSMEAADEQPDRQPEIRLSARRRGDALELVVTDNGPGFPLEDTEKLFATDYSTKGRGSGIGLSSVRRVARSMGGDVQLLSRGPGAGAQAILNLPIKDD